MGCDIHLAVEVRRAAGMPWRRALPPESARSPWLVEQAAKCTDPTNSWTGWYATRAERVWYDGRNYRLFGVLADVRNGIGFAGIVTGDAVRPIAEPRGLPDDMSADVAALEDGNEENDVWLGDHSHSWLTLAELQAYPWNEGAASVGVVTLEQFTERVTKYGAALPLVTDEHPYSSWCGDVSGPHIVTRSASDVLAALANGGLVTAPDERTHVRDRWTVPIRAQVKEWCDRVMPALADLGSPDDVRIVFGFDS